MRSVTTFPLHVLSGSPSFWSVWPIRGFRQAHLSKDFFYIRIQKGMHLTLGLAINFAFLFFSLVVFLVKDKYTFRVLDLLPGPQFDPLQIIQGLHSPKWSTPNKSKVIVNFGKKSINVWISWLLEKALTSPNNRIKMKTYFHSFLNADMWKILYIYIDILFWSRASYIILLQRYTIF